MDSRSVRIYKVTVDAAETADTRFVGEILEELYNEFGVDNETGVKVEILADTPSDAAAFLNGFETAQFLRYLLACSDHEKFDLQAHVPRIKRILGEK